MSDPNHILMGGGGFRGAGSLRLLRRPQAFPHISEQMMAEVDKADSAKFDREDILNPQGWVLLSFLMDPRTGLGRFRDFRVSNYQLMMQLIDYCREHTIEETSESPRRSGADRSLSGALR